MQKHQDILNRSLTIENVKTIAKLARPEEIKETGSVSTPLPLIFMKQPELKLKPLLSGNVITEKIDHHET